MTCFLFRTWVMLVIVLAILWCFFMTPIVLAQEAPGDTGWNWYNEKPVSDEDVTDDRRPFGSPSEAGPAPFGTAWLRERIPLALDMAVDNPTEENVIQYLLLQKLAMDRAEEFARVAHTANIGDPLLDPRRRAPSSTAGVAGRVRETRVIQERLLDDLADRIGIFFFFKDGCESCDRQAATLSILQNQFDIAVTAVSIDGSAPPPGYFSSYLVDEGQAERFGVRGAPSLFVFSPPNNIALMSEGSVSLTVLKERTIAVAATMGVISEEELEASRYLPPPDPTDFGDIPFDIDIDDPAAVIAIIRARQSQKEGVR